MLPPHLYLVQFPSITLQEFTDGAAQSDLLFTATNKPRLEFPTVKRAGLLP